MSPITSSEIRQQRDKLAEHLADLDAEAAERAFDAVSGDQDAAKRLAAIDREIARAHIDEQALRRAQAVAVERENDAAARADAAERTKAKEEACQLAGELQRLAARADDLTRQFGELISEIDKAERAAHAALRKSGTAHPGTVGGNGLSEIAMTRLDIAVRGARHWDRRKVAEIAASGWRFLLELETDETEDA